ncbi:MAG: hypothetical protein EU551_02875 [Promethearchaeota archaeon]|nr:MAG: hypothetical protein EU551_02875 [Candidatus Lokiarchaeota archaeon]
MIEMALPEDKIQTLQKLLSNLESHTELEATAVVTIEGMRVACAVSGDLDADVYSAASAALVNLGETTLKQLQHGSLKEIIVRGDDGYTILTRATSTYMVVGSCKIGSRMGYYLALLHRFCKKVEKIVGEGEPQIERPTAPPVKTSIPTTQTRATAQQGVSMNQQPRIPSPSPRISEDKEAVESALDALSLLEETPPPTPAASNQGPVTLQEEITPLPPQVSSDSVDLEDALKTLEGASGPTPSQATVDVNTDALIDALKPEPTPQAPVASTQPPFTGSQPSETPSPTSSSSDDIFNISDKEAVLEALKVLGWEEDENE